MTIDSSGLGLGNTRDTVTALAERLVRHFNPSAPQPTMRDENMLWHISETHFRSCVNPLPPLPPRRRVWHRKGAVAGVEELNPTLIETLTLEP